MAVMTGNAIREALEPCPFCGGNAQVREDDGTFCVSCTAADCYAAVGEGYDRSAMPDHIFSDEDAAIAAWNRRARTACDAIGSVVPPRITAAMVKAFYEATEVTREGSIRNIKEGLAAAISCLSTHTTAGAGPVGEAVAWRWRLRSEFNGEWGPGAWATTSLFPDLHDPTRYEVEPLYVRPVDEPGVVERLRADLTYIARKIDAPDEDAAPNLALTFWKEVVRDIQGAAHAALKGDA